MNIKVNRFGASQRASANGFVSTLVFSAVLCLAGCGGSGSTHSTSNSPLPTVTPPVTTSPVTPTQTPTPVQVLNGTASSLASTALVRTRDRAADANDLSGHTLLTRIAIALAPTTTIGQFNAAMNAVGATAITSSESNSLIVVIGVPRQSNVAAIHSLAKTLRAQAGIAFAWPGQTAKASVLPQLSPGVFVAPTALSHLLGPRFPQAWNARNAAPADCLPRVVSVYVFDTFGFITQRPTFLAAMPPNSFFFDPRGAGPADISKPGHGYDVAATLAATFDGTRPTGANPFPDCVEVNQLEAGGYELIDAIRASLLAVVADPDRHVIVTSSLNFVDDGICGATGDQACDTQSVVDGADLLRGAILSRAMQAAAWAQVSRDSNLVDKMLVTQSAGNTDPAPAGFLPRNYLGFRAATLASAAALATHLSDLKAIWTDPTLWKSSTPGLPDLTFDDATATQALQAVSAAGALASISSSNLLLVDSGKNAAAFTDITPSNFNFVGADVRAVGEDILGLGNDLLIGTSFSTPAVAGLAAYLWNLSPALNAQPPAATVAHIRSTSAKTANSPDIPLIDAYAAVLKLDSVSGCCSGNVFAPIRLGLMDVDGDGKFTSADLQKFVTALNAAASTPTDPDYSRFDLNGDGFTGGIYIARFNLDGALDANGNPRIATVDEEIEGYPITFNEAALSDMQILCFYAYSILYATESDPSNPQRENLLGPNKCIGMQMGLTVTQNIPSNGSGSVSISLQQPAGAGQFAAAVGVPYHVTATGGSVSPSSGVTDSQGHATATITPGTNSTSVQVTAVATAPANGTTVLAQAVASASVVATTENSTTNYSGSFLSTCHGLIFPGQPPPPPVTKSGTATAQFSVFNGQAGNASIVAPADPFFKFGLIATLTGPLNGFTGFINPGNSFTWTITGTRANTHLQISVEEIGNNCTFVFDGEAVQ